MRYCGKIGYIWTEERVENIDGELVPTGVFEQHSEERTYMGDVLKLSSRWESTEHLNDDLKLGNSFSILADPFAFENFSHMKYIEFMGAKWSIVTVDVQRPRLILTIGGVYNGEQAITA